MDAARFKGYWIGSSSPFPSNVVFVAITICLKDNAKAYM